MSGAARIFLCDDNTGDLQLLQLALNEACKAGVDVTTSCSGAEALSTLAQGAKAGVVPTLIVTDHLMPGLDGPAFLAELKQHEAFRDVPAVLLSGAATGRPIPHVCEILTKPETWEGYEQVAKHLVANYLS